MKTHRNRIISAFVGCGIGDALGAPIEGLSLSKRKPFGHLAAYTSNPEHPWNAPLQPGQWTDDTQLTLAVAEALIAGGGNIHMGHIAERHMTALQEARKLHIGWGRTTTRAVEQLLSGTHWISSGRDLGEGCGAGNGIAMKMAPIGTLLFADATADVSDIFPLATMTHASVSGIAAGVAQATAIETCLRADWDAFEEKAFLMQLIMNIDRDMQSAITFAKAFQFPSADIQSLLFRVDQLRDLIYQEISHRSKFALRDLSCETIARIFGANGFHAADSLPTTWAFFFQNPQSIEALYNVVNAGGDSDSNGAMVGALLGALNGLDIFPQHLIDGLWQRERIIETAEKLCDVLEIPD